VIGIIPRGRDAGPAPPSFFAACALLLVFAASCLPQGKISAPLPPVPPGGTLRVLVDLDDQVDLERLGRALARRKLTKRERRAAVIAALGTEASRSQERLRPVLERLKREGLVRSWRGFTIVNRLLVEATPAGVEALARLRGVAAIVPETEIREPALAGQDAPSAGKTSWGVAAVGADAAWKMGLDGAGIVVGLIDSGATAAHEQLAPGFRGGERSWLDPKGGSNAPRDSHLGHGTGVLSCAVGANAAGVTLGVAPRAQWIACAGLPEGRFNNVLLTICADWMLTVGRPDVLLAAWVLPSEGCDRSFQPLVDAWRAAEILPVFPAGNRGPDERTDRSPANYDGLYPGGRTALSVGGLGRNGEIWEKTSRGPSACGGPVFPTASAPAEELVTAFPLSSSTYRQAQGTSFAAGLAAGAAALLLQRHPEASVVELEEALTGGDGRLDLPGALARLHRIRGESGRYNPPP
jgi:subtilisin family serine protease